MFCQRPATLLKKRLWRRCFPVNFAEFLRTPFLTEHLRWLLLNWEPNKVNLNGTEIKSSKNWKLLGVHIDKRLRFDVHIKSLCKTECSQQNKSNFSYGPLMWMICSCSLNNSLNHIHKRTLRLVYDDHVQLFQNIPGMSNEKTVHQKILESLAKEMYRFLHDLSLPIMNDVFVLPSLGNFKREIKKWKGEKFQFRIFKG